MGVVCLYFFLQGGKGGRSIFLHPLVTIAWTLAGQLVGVGIVGPLVVPLLLVASKVAAPARDGLPPPPTKLYIYTIIGFQVLTTILAGAMANVPPTETVWPALHFAFQIFPLYYLPLAFLPLSSNKKHVETEPSTLTATVFKVLFYLQLPTWCVYPSRSCSIDVT